MESIGILFAVGIPLLVVLAMIAGGMAKKHHEKEERAAREAAAVRRAEAEAAEKAEREAKAQQEKEKREHELEKLKALREIEREDKAFQLEHEKVLLGDDGVCTEGTITQIGSFRNVRFKQTPKKALETQETAVVLCKETKLSSDGSLTTGRGAEHVRADAELELARSAGRGGFYDAAAKVADAGARRAESERAMMVRMAPTAPATTTTTAPATDLSAKLAEAEQKRLAAEAERDKLRAEAEAAKKAAAGKEAGGKEKEAPKEGGEKGGRDAGKGGGGHKAA